VLSFLIGLVTCTCMTECAWRSSRIFMNFIDIMILKTLRYPSRVSTHAPPRLGFKNSLQKPKTLRLINCSGSRKTENWISWIRPGSGGATTVTSEQRWETLGCCETRVSLCDVTREFVWRHRVSLIWRGEDMRDRGFIHFFAVDNLLQNTEQVVFLILYPSPLFPQNK